MRAMLNCSGQGILIGIGRASQNTSRVHTEQFDEYPASDASMGSFLVDLGLWKSSKSNVRENDQFGGRGPICGNPK